MKVLMFGWEFPPYNSGGLGTACYGLTKSLNKQGADITFVIPKAPGDVTSEHVNLVVANNIKAGTLKITQIKSYLYAYMSPEEYDEKVIKTLIKNNSKDPAGALYGKNLFEEVQRFAERAKVIAQYTDFDVIHGHDWMTYPACIKAKEATGKPLVVHVHATEFDRTGDHPNQGVYDIERWGMHAADKIIAVSNFTKNKIVEHYGIPPWKVEVVHNGVEFNNEVISDHEVKGLAKDDKVVLFLGRITIQKGPDYFLYAAKKVLEVYPDVKFVIAGSGDMEPFIINKAAELGMGHKVLFTGFLKGKEIDKAYKMANLYVMPSISEPFGITPLESMRNGTPVIISKQSGVSEVIKNCLKVDFWDVNELANKIVGVLKYQAVHEVLKEGGKKEVKNLSWDIPAEKCMNVYNDLLHNYQVMRLV